MFSSLAYLSSIVWSKVSLCEQSLLFLNLDRLRWTRDREWNQRCLTVACRCCSHLLLSYLLLLRCHHPLRDSSCSPLSRGILSRLDMMKMLWKLQWRVCSFFHTCVVTRFESALIYVRLLVPANGGVRLSGRQRSLSDSLRITMKSHLDARSWGE